VIEVEADVASRPANLRLPRVTVTLRERYVQAVIKAGVASRSVVSSVNSVPHGGDVNLRSRQGAGSGRKDDGESERGFGEHGIPPFMANIDRTV
jgi:hypothetical protein